MSVPAAEITLDFNLFSDEGLYLLFPDASRLILTIKNISQVTERFWNEIDRHAADLKQAIDFQRCAFCPLAGKEDFCDALRPILPFLDIMENFASFTGVTAIYRDAVKNIFSISQTTMQNALQYISILSLTHYCQVGRKYRKYYWGIDPWLTSEEVARRLLLNIFWFHKGNEQEMHSAIAKFSEEIRRTSKNQVNRLNLITKSDAFKNAFVNAQIAPSFLRLGAGELLLTAFNDYEK